jgi:DNA-binding CsgD family transcriptional regulator
MAVAFLEEFISASSTCRSESDLRGLYLHDLHALTAQYRSRLGELQGNPTVSTQALTPKELECLSWCKEGKTNWEIGEIMSISEKTVEFHLSNTIRKLRVSNRITAVVKGIQLGIISI